MDELIESFMPKREVEPDAEIPPIQPLTLSLKRSQKEARLDRLLASVLPSWDTSDEEDVVDSQMSTQPPPDDSGSLTLSTCPPVDGGSLKLIQETCWYLFSLY